MSECSDILAAINALGSQTGSLKSELSNINQRLTALEQKSNSIESAISNIKDSINGLSALINSLKTEILTTISQGFSQFNESINAVKEVILASIGSFKDLLLASINALRDVLLNFLNIFQPGGGDCLTEAKARDMLSGTAIYIIGSITSELSSPLNEILRILKDFKVEVDYDRIAGFVASARDNINGSISSARDTIIRKIEELGSGIQSIKDDINSIVNDARNKILERLTEVNGQITSTGDTIKSHIASARDSILEELKRGNFFDYSRIESYINSSHIGTRDIINSALLGVSNFLAAKIDVLNSKIDNINFNPTIDFRPTVNTPDIDLTGIFAYLQLILQAVLNINFNPSFSIDPNFNFGNNNNDSNCATKADIDNVYSNIYTNIYIPLQGLFNFLLDSVISRIVNTENNLTLNISNSETKVIDEINELDDSVKNTEYNIDVVNQVNVDSEPLVNIVADINNSIDLQANLIVSNLLVALTQLNVDFSPIIELVNNSTTEIENKIDDALANVDFTVDVVNQVNVDSQPLAEIVSSIENKIDVQVNSIISGVLAGIITPTLNIDIGDIIASLTLINEKIDSLREEVQDAEYNIDIINQVNIDSEPLVNIVSEINNRIELQANFIISNILLALPVNISPTIDIDFSPVIELINNSKTEIENKIDERLANIDYNIDVINQVNIDSEPLGQIVSSIENKIDVQINSIISGVLAGIIIPTLNIDIGDINNSLTIINEKIDNLDDRIADTEYIIDVINQVNIDSAPLAEIVTTINNKIDLQVNNIISGVLAGIINISPDIDINPVLNIINDFRSDVQEYLQNTEYNIDVINQVNVDTEPLVQIVQSINNSIELQSNTILSNILTNISANVDISPLLQTIAEFRVELQNFLNSTDFNIDVINQVNIDSQPIADVFAEINNKLDTQETNIISGVLTNITSIVVDRDNENATENCFPLYPGEQFAEFEIPTQLSLTFGEEYPKTTGSLWHMNIPNPIHWSELNWCTHFEPMIRHMGDYQGRCYFRGSKMWVGGYAESQENITQFLLNHILPLSTLPYQTRPDGSPRIRTTTGGNVKRQPESKTLRCVRAVYAEIDPLTNKTTNVRCFYPPTEGCG